MILWVMALHYLLDFEFFGLPEVKTTKKSVDPSVPLVPWGKAQKKPDNTKPENDVWLTNVP